jgi:hypothetical protein
MKSFEWLFAKQKNKKKKKKKKKKIPSSAFLFLSFGLNQHLFYLFFLLLNVQYYFLVSIIADCNEDTKQDVAPDSLRFKKT